MKKKEENSSAPYYLIHSIPAVILNGHGKNNYLLDKRSSCLLPKRPPVWKNVSEAVVLSGIVKKIDPRMHKTTVVRHIVIISTLLNTPGKKQKTQYYFRITFLPNIFRRYNLKFLHSHTIDTDLYNVQRIIWFLTTIIMVD